MAWHRESKTDITAYHLLLKDIETQMEREDRDHFMETKSQNKRKIQGPNTSVHKFTQYKNYFF